MTGMLNTLHKLLEAIWLVQLHIKQLLVEGVVSTVYRPPAVTFGMWNAWNATHAVCYWQRGVEFWPRFSSFLKINTHFRVFTTKAVHFVFEVYLWRYLAVLDLVFRSNLMQFLTNMHWISVCAASNWLMKLLCSGAPCRARFCHPLAICIQCRINLSYKRNEKSHFPLSVHCHSLSGTLFSSAC